MREKRQRVRCRLRDLAGLAYERELSRELDSLFKYFEAWRRKELDAFELSDRIHQFHQKPARDLYVFYTGRYPEAPVAKAIADGILSEEEAGAEIFSLLQEIIASFRKASRL